MVELEAGKLQMEHKNILKIYGVGRNNLIDQGNDLGERYFVVTEVCENGELFEFVISTGGFSEEVTRKVFAQIAESVYYLHKKGCAHRDIKLENIFLDENCVPKLADFGLMKRFSGAGGKLLETALGT